MASNYPPGVRTSDIPGWRSQDVAFQNESERIADMLYAARKEFVANGSIDADVFEYVQSKWSAARISDTFGEAMDELYQHDNIPIPDEIEEKGYNYAERSARQDAYLHIYILEIIMVNL